MRTCLITGGAGGIARATADVFTDIGWRVIAPSRAELDLDPLRRKPYTLPTELDAVVLAHGVWYSKPLDEQWTADWWDQYRQRVIGPLQFVREMLPRLERSHGCVVAVASTRGLIGGAETGPYSAACAAMIASMVGYAREIQGVRFNVVAPGLTDTPMAERVRATGGAKPDAVAQPAAAVAAEIVRLIESGDNGRVMRVVDGKAAEAKWTW